MVRLGPKQGQSPICGMYRFGGCCSKARNMGDIKFRGLVICPSPKDCVLMGTLHTFAPQPKLLFYLGQPGRFATGNLPLSFQLLVLSASKGWFPGYGMSTGQQANPLRTMRITCFDTNNTHTHEDSHESSYHPKNLILNDNGNSFLLKPSNTR